MRIRIPAGERKSTTNPSKLYGKSPVNLFTDDLPPNW